MTINELADQVLAQMQKGERRIRFTVALSDGEKRALVVTLVARLRRSLRINWHRDNMGFDY